MFMKNILIFGNDGDLTVQYVMDWLYYFRVKISKITGGRTNVLSPYICIDNEKTKMSLLLNEVEINNKNIHKIWLHRLSPTKFKNVKDKSSCKVDKFISDFQTKEQFVYLNYFLSQFSITKYTVSPNLLYLNKLEILKMAQKHGFIVPPTCISTYKADIIEFKEKHCDIIIKPLSECMSITYNNDSLSIFTTKISSNLLDKQNDYLFPVFAQKYIEKQYEIRVFYIDGCCYSMAIFSQQNRTTAIDWRQKTAFYSNRNVPYNLPSDIEEKIKSLMNDLSLKTGSIDLIYSKENEYVFLEINPVGQFGMVSHLCNYSLYKKFAEFILK